MLRSPDKTKLLTWEGGGRGMRVIRRKEDVEEAIAASQSEARSAFGSGEVYMERSVSWLPKLALERCEGFGS